MGDIYFELQFVRFFRGASDFVDIARSEATATTDAAYASDAADTFDTSANLMLPVQLVQTLYEQTSNYYEPVVLMGRKNRFDLLATAGNK